MPKYMYLREDGRYDTYDVEPKIITAAEYATLKRREELQAHEEQLLISRAKLDAEIASVKQQIAALSAAPIESAEPSTSVVSTISTAADSTAKRKW